jgi:hypothetical protein
MPRATKMASLRNALGEAAPFRQIRTTT